MLHIPAQHRKSIFLRKAVVFGPAKTLRAAALCPQRQAAQYKKESKSSRNRLHCIFGDKKRNSWQLRNVGEAAKKSKYLENQSEQQKQAA